MAYGKREGLGFKIDSRKYDELVRHIKTVTDHKIRRTEIQKIIIRQMKPIEAGVKAKTPVRKADGNSLFKFKGKEFKGVTIQQQYNLNMKITENRTSIKTKRRIAPRGNLKRSIRTSKNNDKSRSQVGARVHPAKGLGEKYDGFYGWWHVYGWTPFIKEGKQNHGKRIPPNDFLWKGAVSKIPSSATGMSDELEKYITRKLRRINK